MAQADQVFQGKAARVPPGPWDVIVVGAGVYGLGSAGLNLGKNPRDIAGGAYYMNPEELPFEGVVLGTGGGVFYAGSGCGTGFKLGPGVAWLLAERLAGVPRERRLIASAALSAERATYFYPPGTSRDELLRQFRPAAEGGRLIEMGAAGIAISRG